MAALSRHAASADAGAGRSENPIVIGLVNNMPDAALHRTERQFYELILAASHGYAVRWRLFYIPELPRSAASPLHLDKSYEDIGALWTSRVDGLIVTGTEPRMAALTDEPYWPTLTKLVDWADDHTISSVWSCLAAHAAVLHIDDIPRCPLDKKLSGIFDCNKVGDHPLSASAPSRWHVPHSRHNGLSEEALISKGYQVLSRSPEAGLDIFVKHRKSLFVFLQGHPEYDTFALLREYRRDIARYLDGESDSYPKMPRHYFDYETRAMLAAYRERALSEVRLEDGSSFPSIATEELPHSWQSLAIQLYTNWFSYLVADKAE